MAFNPRIYICGSHLLADNYSVSIANPVSLSKCSWYVDVLYRLSRYVRDIHTRYSEIIIKYIL